jgi:hypothetical protein
MMSIHRKASQSVMQKSEGIGNYNRAFLRLGMGIAGPETGHQ